ncbi:MAG: hypothetical protein JNM99_17100 [Verrucomicrobiaceae bacterium]|nr:hypothetical protein [Verrucomicrobiaceae bacterium]
MRLELHEQLYEHFKAAHTLELERIDKIRDRVSFVVGFLTLLGGVIGTFVTSFPHAWHCGRTLLFYVPLAVSISLFSWAASLVLWVVGGKYLYEAMPDNPEIIQYAEGLSTWADSAAVTEADLVREFKKDLALAYSKASQHNYTINRRRADRLGYATRLVVFTFLPVALMLPSFLYESSQKPDKPTQVQIVSSPTKPTEPAKLLPMSTPTNSGKAQEQAKPAQQAPAQQQSTGTAKPTAARPSFPQNNLVTEAVSKMETKKAK